MCNLGRFHAAEATVKHISTQICKVPHHSFHVSDASWRDYVRGASFALNPLPEETRNTFITSDVQAIHSDWVTAGSDMMFLCDMAKQINELLGEIAKKEGIEKEDDGESASKGGEAQRSGAGNAAAAGIAD